MCCSQPTQLHAKPGGHLIGRFYKREMSRTNYPHRRKLSYFPAPLSEQGGVSIGHTIRSAPEQWTQKLGFLS
jgi:hypothetical protein